MVALEAFSIMYIVDIGRIGLSNGPYVYQLSVSSVINKTPQATFLREFTEREKEMQN